MKNDEFVCKNRCIESTLKQAVETVPAGETGEMFIRNDDFLHHK